MKKPVQTNCESCEFYDYDPLLDAYVCNNRLDQDEQFAFLTASAQRCPYYRFHDEYKTVEKQI